MSRHIWLITTVHRSDDHRIYWKFAKSLSKEFLVQIITSMEKVGNNDDASIRVTGISANESKFSRILYLWALMKRIIDKKPPIIIFFDFEILFIIPAIRIFSPSTRILYDYHEDFISMVMHSKKFILPARFILALFFLIIDIIIMPLCTGITVSDRYLYRRSCKINKRVQLIYNFPVYRHIEAKKHTGAVLEFVYAGGLFHERALAEMIEYFGQSKHTLTLIGRTFTEAENVYLMKALDKYTNIRHIEHMEYDTLLYHLHNYDFGLVYMKLNSKFRRNISVKQFDYMMAGVPVFIRKGHVSFIRDGYNGYNIDCLDDIDSITSQLNENDIYAMRLNCQQSIYRHYHWESEEIKLLDIVKHIP